METQDDLLQPTLGRDDSPATSIYSAGTGYIVSFLGGPLAGATIALVNAHRLNRLGTDWPLGLLAAIATVVPMWWWFHGGGPWLISHVGNGAQGLLLRGLGLGFFVLVYGWHRQYYRNMALFGLKPPSGWVIGVVAVIGSFAVRFALAHVLS
jgi:hypothetical protein